METSANLTQCPSDVRYSCQLLCHPEIWFVLSLLSLFLFRSMHIHGGAKVRPFLCPVAQPAVGHYVFTLYVPCQYRLARRAIRAGRRPACCSCGRVHSCANMNSPAGGRIHSREKNGIARRAGKSII